MKLANKMTDEQLKRLEPLYPKWVQFQNEKTLRLSGEQVALMGGVWSEVMGKRWTGGCQACTVNAFSTIMNHYDAELDRRHKAIHEQIMKEANDAIGKAVFTESEPTEIVNTKQTTDATTEKKPRRNKK
jgi:predicted  nucleic acid-binding Zn-ribbon protein